MPDPRARDPRFPDRPTHPDFIRLSEAVQTHDAMAEQLDVTPFAVMGVDEESFMYFLKNRLGGVSQRLHRDFTQAGHMALYLDAFALGKRFAESAAEDAPATLTKALADRLNDFEARGVGDKLDLELTCTRCGETVCDIEHEDTLDVLVRTALGHDCEEEK